MGLIAATVNTQYLIAYQNELEYKISLINQSKIGLQDTTSELMNAGTDLDPNNPAIKQLEKRRERLNSLEKKLEMQLQEYQTKLEIVKKNLEKSKEMEKESIK